MAYASSVNAPILLTPGPIASGNSTGMSGYGQKLWSYISTADAVATVIGSSYISDGFSRGMRKYDVVLFTDVASTIQSILTVTTVTSTSGGVTLSSLLATT